MTFGEYLNECIDKRDIPIAKITRISGINRGKLYNVFYNKRKLSEEELFSLIEKSEIASRFPRFCILHSAFCICATNVAHCSERGRLKNAPTLRMQYMHAWWRVCSRGARTRAFKKRPTLICNVCTRGGFILQCITRPP